MALPQTHYFLIVATDPKRQNQSQKCGHYREKKKPKKRKQEAVPNYHTTFNKIMGNSSNFNRTYAKLRWLGCSEEFRQHVACSRNDIVLQDYVRPARAEPKTVHLYDEANATTPASVLRKSLSVRKRLVHLPELTYNDAY